MIQMIIKMTINQPAPLMSSVTKEYDEHNEYDDGRYGIYDNDDDDSYDDEYDR